MALRDLLPYPLLCIGFVWGFSSVGRAPVLDISGSKIPRPRVGCPMYDEEPQIAKITKKTSPPDLFCSIIVLSLIVCIVAATSFYIWVPGEPAQPQLMGDNVCAVCGKPATHVVHDKVTTGSRGDVAYYKMVDRYLCSQHYSKAEEGALWISLVVGVVVGFGFFIVTASVAEAFQKKKKASLDHDGKFDPL